MEGVTEHCEGYAVELEEIKDGPNLLAFNEAGYNSTSIDLKQLIAWLRANRPEMLR